MTDPRPTTVYYNSACPVCDAGIRGQRERMQGCAVEWVDVHANPDAVAPLGVSLEQVRERLHVVEGEGRVRVGAQALESLWAQTPGQRWLGRLMRLPLLSALAGALYDRFARVLYRWNLRKGHWQVAAAAPSPAINADPVELEKFSALAIRWWDPDSEFRPLHRLNPMRLAWIGALASLRGKAVLDVGCGGGILAEAMAHQGAVVTGIDLAQAPLAVARLHALRTGAPVQYLASSAEDLAERQPRSFDVVTCMEMLEHVPHPEGVIEACARLARPGGWVFFSTINRNPLSFLMAIVGAEYVLRLLPRGTHRWDRFIRPQELVAAASRHGLVLHEARGLGYNPFTQRFRLHGFLGVGYLLAMKVGAEVGRNCSVPPYESRVPSSGATKATSKR
jgi:2-polyprenyl-6-hydroxyphenyl methylase / 3-demethylubiquinone-9 3-methyltransferase